LFAIPSTINPDRKNFHATFFEKLKPFKNVSLQRAVLQFFSEHGRLQDVKHHKAGFVYAPHFIDVLQKNPVEKSNIFDKGIDTTFSNCQLF